MTMQDFAVLLKSSLQGEVRTHEPMARHTSFHIGGPADFLIIPRNVEDIRQALRLSRLQGVPLTVLGNGSNVLVRDKGIRGVVLKLGNALKQWEQNENRFTFGSGIALAQCSRIIGEAGFSGMEFAVGIPGSLGGALYMNAGAYGGEMKDVVVSASVLDEDGEMHWLSKEELQLRYRHSSLQETRHIVLDITLEVTPADRGEVLAKMEEFSRRRISKQPLEMPSAGSTFKRPEDCFVGPLIENAGLKGFRIGGAQISEKHAGFIVNAGDATAADVIALIEYIREKIWQDCRVQLTPEVLIIGEK